jgi:hypothetical protein
MVTPSRTNHGFDFEELLPCYGFEVSRLSE